MDEFKEIQNCHKIFHRFYNWLIKNFGKDLYSEYEYIKFKNEVTGRTNKIKFRSYNDFELSQRLVGFEVIDKIEKYIKKNLPEIKIIRCDDSVYAGSIILLVPHPEHGITVMFIPQCTSIQNTFFLYGNDYRNLMKGLSELEYVYKNDDSII